MQHPRFIMHGLPFITIHSDSFSLFLNFYWLVLISRLLCLFSTLFGFIVNLDLDLALRPLWKIFTSEKIIGYHSPTNVFEMTSDSSSSSMSSTVTAVSIPRPINSEQCRYILTWYDALEIQYPGWDLHYHPSSRHHDLFTGEYQAITIRFCYRPFHQDGTAPRYIIQKHTTVSVPQRIIFRQLDRNGQLQHKYISMGRLYRQFESLSDEEKQDHSEHYHESIRRA
jgi:hypothetical protein